MLLRGLLLVLFLGLLYIFLVSCESMLGLLFLYGVSVLDKITASTFTETQVALFSAIYTSTECGTIGVRCVVCISFLE